MTDAELKEIEARCDAATEGPWEVGYCYGLSRDARCACSVKPAGGEYYYTDAIVASDARDECGHPMFLVDAEFIAHARADVPALIAEVRRLRNE